MRLDTGVLRYLTNEDWRLLTAVETGSRNHEVVPTPLITSFSGVKGGGAVQRSLSTLAKANLIAKVKNAKYDGYRLTYGGLDYLALHAHQRHGTIYSVGNQIGVGKESDIFVVADHTGKQFVLKIHRLGRISFRSVKSNRDYKGKGRGTSGSWMYMSRLAATKEFMFMKALSERGLPVPQPIGHNRHTIVMDLIDAFPLRQITAVPDPAELYGELMELLLRLAALGLIHGDYNEFNILVPGEDGGESPTRLAEEKAPVSTSPSEVPAIPETHISQSPIQSQQQQHSEPLPATPIIIDFPQMVSMDHTNARFYFDRDVACIKRYFNRRFSFVSDEAGPTFADAQIRLRGNKTERIDVALSASGFSVKMAKELESYMRAVGADGDHRQGDGDGEPNRSDQDTASALSEGVELGDDDDDEVDNDGKDEDGNSSTNDRK